MDTPPILLIHGAATTSRVWRFVVPLLTEQGLHVLTPERPCSGDLDAEIQFLRPLARGAVVAGVSGGATLGWELASREHGSEPEQDPAAAVLHEPAAGSLRPGLLDAARAALSQRGPGAFARELYGPAWTPQELGDSELVADDVGMFAGFEPQPPRYGAIHLTVGANSPAPRHEVAAAYAERFGLESEPLQGASHAVHLEAPQVFAAAILRAVEDLRG